MRRTKEDAEKTRQQLLEAANIIFRKKGYAATNLGEIAAAVDLTRGAITWHFLNKQTIFRSLILDSAMDAMHRVEENVKRPVDPLEKVIGFIKDLVHDRERKHGQICLLNKLLEESPAEFEDLKEKVISVQGFIIESYKGIIREGIAKGVFRTSIDPSFIAKSFLTFFWGFFTNYPIIYREYTDDQLVHHMTDYFSHLLQPAEKLKLKLVDSHD